MALFFVPLLLSAATVFAQIPRPAAQCSGYRATNIHEDVSYVTADLVLIGNCTLHSKDIQSLRLLVEYQTGTVNRSKHGECD